MKSTPATFSTDLVKKIADLANIPIDASEQSKLATSFSETIGVIDNLSELDTDSVEPTAHTTGLENVFRDDKVNQTTTFSQHEALSNATKSHAGYFIVPRILHHEK